MRSIGSTTITPKNFDEYKEKVFQMERRRDKALTQRKWASVVSNIVFFVAMLSATYFFADMIEVSVFPQLLFLGDFWKDIVLSPLPLSYDIMGGWVIPISILVASLFALAVHLLTMLVVGAIYSGKSPEAPTGSKAEQAAALSKRCEAAGAGLTPKEEWTAAWTLAGAYALIFLLPTLLDQEELAYLLVRLLAFPCIVLPIYVIPCAVLWALTDFLYRARPDTTLKVQFDEYEKFCIRQEEQRKKAEEERKRAEKAEEKRKQVERLRIEGDKVYHQATAGDKVDKVLIKQAAQMGSRPACLYMGRKKMQEWSSGAYTKEEKEEIAREAKRYFKVACVEQDTEAEKTEARFGYLTFQALTESGSKSKWKGVLAELRGIQKSGLLPKNYDESCEWLISAVIDMIDRAVDQPTYSTSSTTYSTTTYPSYSSDLPSSGLTYADHDDLDAVQRAIDNPDRDPEASEPDADSSGSWDAW